MKEKPYILVVDDDPNIAKLEQLYLEKAGYEVKTVGRGDDAMTEFRKMPPAMARKMISAVSRKGTLTLPTPMHRISVSTVSSANSRCSRR